MRPAICCSCRASTPTNVVFVNDLGSARFNAGDGLIDLGRSREGIARLLQDRGMREKAAARVSLAAGQLMNTYRYAILMSAELGQAASVEKYQADWFRNARAWSKAWPAGYCVRAVP